MGVGPQTLRYLLLAEARREHIKTSYLQNPGPSGYSDHEPFERDQIPAAWIEWRDDPVYHTAADTSSHLVKSKVQTTGKFLLDFLYGLDEAQLEKLAR